MMNKKTQEKGQTTTLHRLLTTIHNETGLHRFSFHREEIKV